jgi:hypothetical protein
MQQHRNVKSDRKLSAQLDAYAVSVRANLGAGWKERLRGWAPYAAAVGSGLALASACDADIIYSGPQNDTLTISKTTGPTGFHSTAKKSFNLASGKNFRIQVQAFVTADVGLQSVGFYGGTGVFPLLNADNQMKKLASGAKISAVQSHFPAAYFFRHVTNRFYGSQQASGTWPASQTGFAGFDFKVTGGEDFGWVRLHWSASVAGHPDSVKIVDYAYNNVPGDPILAGQTTEESSAVPEPSTIALALLASGAAGVLAWRKRRQGVVAGEA